MDGDGRVHPLDRRRRASASRRLASGWPERSGGIRRADRRDAKRHAYRIAVQPPRDGHSDTKRNPEHSKARNSATIVSIAGSAATAGWAALYP